jgi:hypothetical protein
MVMSYLITIDPNPTDAQTGGDKACCSSATECEKHHAIKQCSNMKAMSEFIMQSFEFV